jgi:hypothetical protein
METKKAGRGRPRIYTHDSSCSVEGCPMMPSVKGMCIKHYARAKRTGSPVFGYKSRLAKGLNKGIKILERIASTEEDRAKIYQLKLELIASIGRRS